MPVSCAFVPVKTLEKCKKNYVARSDILYVLTRVGSSRIYRYKVHNNH